MAFIDLVLTDYETLRVFEALQTLHATYQHHGRTRELQDLDASVHGFLDQLQKHEEAREGRANDPRDDLRFCVDRTSLAALRRTLDLVLPHERQKTHLPPDKQARRLAALTSVADKLAKAAAVLVPVEDGLADGSLRILGPDGSWL